MPDIIEYEPIETLRGFWQAAEILVRDQNGKPIEYRVSGNGHTTRATAEAECAERRAIFP